MVEYAAELRECVIRRVPRRAVITDLEELHLEVEVRGRCGALEVNSSGLHLTDDVTAQERHRVEVEHRVSNCEQALAHFSPFDVTAFYYRECRASVGRVCVANGGDLGRVEFDRESGAAGGNGQKGDGK